MAMTYHEALMTQAADGVMIYHEKLRFPESGHLFKRVPLVGNHCRLARLEYFGSNSYVYFECQESDGTTCMFVAKIEGWLME